MNNSSREIEIKFELIDYSLEDAYHKIISWPLLGNVTKELVECKTQDIYFKSEGSVDIVRLRDSYGMGNDGFSRNLKEITVKKKDKNTNFNRFEENLKIDNSASAFNILHACFGNPILTLDKEEMVIWTETGLIISLAYVGQEGISTELWLEVEGPTEELVKNCAEKLSTLFLGSIRLEPKNLLELYGE